jgi:hypothetical protein
MYYMFANMSSLNSWRRMRGFSACAEGRGLDTAR